MVRRLVFAAGVVLVTVALAGPKVKFGLKAGQFDAAACTGRFRLVDTLLPSFDSAELRVVGETLVLESAGQPCARAKSREACLARVASATSTRGWAVGSNGRRETLRYLVATRGDDVVVMDAASQVTTALGSIDSAQKAAAVAYLARGYVPACESSVRAVTGGYEVHLTSASCRGPADLVVRVSSSGEVTVVAEQYGRPTCVG
jgi:hypothetical protein